METGLAMRRKRKRRPAPRSSTWTIRYALGAYLMVLTLGALVAGLLTHSDLRLGLGVIVVDIAMLASLIPLYCQHRLRARDLGLRPASPARSVGLVVLAVIAVGIVNLVWLQGILGLKQPDSLGITLRESTAAEVLTGFAVAICAPVVEEIFFRGLLYRALRNRMTTARAALLAGVLFGLIHGVTYPLDTLPPRIVFGVIACLLYEETGSLFPGIVLHCLIDAGGFEVAITGHNRIVFLAFVALGALLLLYPAIRRRQPTPANDSGSRPPEGAQQYKIAARPSLER